MVLYFMFNAIQLNAQAAGNAVYNDKYQPGNNMVDLSLNYGEKFFSNILEANVMINVKASSFVAIFSLTQHGKTIDEVEEAMCIRTEIFKNMLQQQHIEPQQIFIDPVSMVPTYETEVTEKKLSKTFNEIPTGFEMKKNVHITFKEHDQINQIIAIAAKAEVYDLVKVDYTIDNMQATLEQLRDEALKILLHKKAAIEKAGIYLKLTQVGEKNGSIYPIERYSQYYAYKTGIAPSYVVNTKKGVPLKQVTYNYAEKNKTLYYDKVADKQFDKVINPVVGEPMIQVYLSLKSQFEVYDLVSRDAQKIYDDKIKELRLKELELDYEIKKKNLELLDKKKEKLITR